MEGPILGIDLGTTHSAVGVVDSGFPILLADKDGNRITPSAVWYGASGEIEVGWKALRRQAGDPTRVIESVKRLIGAPHKANDHQVLREVGCTPEEVSAEILRELKQIAEWRLGSKCHKAVLTVPAYFNDSQRTATKRAGELAGLEVVRILNEPTAAALAFGLERLGEKNRVAVYDLGGGTFDLSILEMQDGIFQVLATNGDTHLGGDDFDELLCERFLKDASDVPEEASWRFRKEAQDLKKRLSAETSGTARVPLFTPGRSFEKEYDRGDLETLVAPLIERTILCCRRALHDSGLQVEDIDEVVLVGGSTRIPAVRDAVSQFFKSEVNVTQHPDEAIALGATIQAGVMSGSLQKMVLLDVTPLSLGLETYGGLMNVIIPRNTTIPCKAGEMFTNAAESQTRMSVRVLQGEREMARDNWELGELTLELGPGAKGQARVGVQFKIDADGILEVLARDTATNIDRVLKIESAAIDVDDAEVGKMIGESVDFAFEDMAERIFTEAKMKAEEILPAVEMLLGGDDLDSEERALIVEKQAAVKTALESESANLLKAAVAELDSATEAAAARMVERAMSAALDRQLGIS